MLTPEYLASCTDYLLGVCDELDRAIIADIARRIVKTGGISPTARHQIDSAQQAGLLLTEVTKQLASATGASEKEIRRLFDEAAVVGLQNDAKPLILAGVQTDLRPSQQMKDLLSAAVSKTNGDLRNLTMTTGVTATCAYMDAVNVAYMKVQSGAFTYQQAIRDAIKAAAVDGNYVTFPSGRRDHLDVAVRRSVLTGLNQTAAKLTEYYAADMECEYYETSAHAGARPSHSVWQGRIFKIEGATAEYPNFEESTGYGTGAGLCGWNCRHSFYPYWPGISKPAYTPEMLREYDAPKYTYNGEKLTEYDVSQLMREHERGIRESKREIAAYQAAMDATGDKKLKAALQEDFESASMKLKNQEAAYKDLCKQTNHAANSTRTGVAAVKDQDGNILSWNRASAQRARQGAERKFQRLIEGTGADIGGPGTLAKRNALRYNNREESALYDRYLRQVKSGMISPLSTFENYKKQYRAIEDSVVGTTTSNGIKITAQSQHFIERVIGTIEDPKTGRPRSGVSVEDVLDALQHPLQPVYTVTGNGGNASQKFVGKRATATVNPKTGKLIQCNPTRKKTAKRKMQDGR